MGKNNRVFFILFIFAILLDFLFHAILAVFNYFGIGQNNNGKSIFLGIHTEGQIQ